MLLRNERFTYGQVGKDLGVDDLQVNRHRA